MKTYQKHRFTLAEILVAMTVFSILLVLMMQFFSGAKTLWTANEKRAAIHADASVAMDLVSMLLRSSFYTEGSMPFEITGFTGTSRPASGWDSTITFVSDSSMELSRGGSIRYLQFRRESDPAVSGVTDNVLQLRVFSDTDDKFDQCFIPFGPDANNLAGALTIVKTAMNNAGTDNVKPVLRNVTSFKITPVDRNGQALSSSPADLPAAVEVELSLMPDEAAVREYQSLTGTDKTDFQLKNEFTFRRVVWLGDRTLNR